MQNGFRLPFQPEFQYSARILRISSRFRGFRGFRHLARPIVSE